jgi:glutaredoxin
MPKGQEQLRVVMYTRHGCHLCDEARGMLEQLRGRFMFDLELIDVDQQNELAQRYGERIPVIEVGGKERMWGRINAVLLERLLRGQIA